MNLKSRIIWFLVLWSTQAVWFESTLKILLTRKQQNKLKNIYLDYNFSFNYYADLNSFRPQHKETALVKRGRGTFLCICWKVLTKISKNYGLSVVWQSFELLICFINLKIDVSLKKIRIEKKSKLLTMSAPIFMLRLETVEQTSVYV